MHVKVLRKLTNEIVLVLSSLKSCGNQMRLPGTRKKTALCSLSRREDDEGNLSGSHFQADEGQGVDLEKTAQSYQHVCFL